VQQVVWSHDDTKIMTLGDDKTVRIWNAITGQELIVLKESIDKFSEAVWSHDENKILTSNTNGIAKIWNANTGQELSRFIGHNYGYDIRASWNHDEDKVLTNSYDNTVRIWNAITGKELVKLLGHSEGVYQASWNNNESRVLTVSDDSTMRIWDATTGQEWVRLVGHTKNPQHDIVGMGTHAIWSKNENKILTSSNDGTVRIWDAITGHELTRIEIGVNLSTEALWSRDESKILTTSENGKVSVWYAHMTDLLSATCVKVSRNFTWPEWNIYMGNGESTYRPICSNTLIPPDAINGIKNEAREKIRNGQVVIGAQRLKDLNGWLQVNGQFNDYGVDAATFVAEVSATATAEAPTTFSLPLTLIATPSPK